MRIIDNAEVMQLSIWSEQGLGGGSVTRGFLLIRLVWSVIIWKTLLWQQVPSSGSTIPKASDLSLRMTAVKICSPTFPQFKWTASRPLKKVKKSNLMWLKVRKASRLPISWALKQSPPIGTNSRKTPPMRGFFVIATSEWPLNIGWYHDNGMLHHKGIIKSERSNPWKSEASVSERGVYRITLAKKKGQMHYPAFCRM